MKKKYCFVQSFLFKSVHKVKDEPLLFGRQQLYENDAVRAQNKGCISTLFLYYSYVLKNNI
jgi:hypothetical protein